MAFDKGHALLIGVGSYTHVPQASIPISVSDAQAVGDVLRNPKLCGYLPEWVTLLHDGTADRAGILRALDALAKGTSAEDTVLLYYCGHGRYGTDGNYYLTTHDTQVSGDRVVKGTGVSEGDLLDKLRAIPAKRLLLLFDACHSGEISPALGMEGEARSFGDVALPEASAAALLSTGEGRIIITACRPEQKSWWTLVDKLSCFTQALVDGLSGKGYVPNSAGYVSAYALYEHVYRSVKDAAGKLGKTQEPELTVLKGVGPFPVALYRGAADLGTFDTREALPQDTAAHEVEPARSRRLFQQRITAVLRGSGAIAQDHSVAAGECGVAIGGSVRGSTIVTGDGNVVGDHRTSVHTDGGDYVGRDQVVHGDRVRGDKVGRDKITVGDVSGTGIAIGRDARAEVTQGLSGDEIARVFAALTQEVDALPQGPDKAVAQSAVQGLQDEAKKGDQAQESAVRRWLNFLAQTAPDAWEVAVRTFTHPIQGLSLVFQKVAARAKAEREGRGSWTDSGRQGSRQ